MLLRAREEGRLLIVLAVVAGIAVVAAIFIALISAGDGGGFGQGQ
jgi:hypothetical protein